MKHLYDIKNFWNNGEITTQYMNATSSRELEPFCKLYWKQMFLLHPDKAKHGRIEISRHTTGEVIKEIFI